MKILKFKRSTLSLLAVLLPILGLFIYVFLNSGPFAPIRVTTVSVKSYSIAPALFGIGTVEARYTYKIGPTAPGRLKELYVHVGDNVKRGQLLGIMDPVDLNERIHAQDAATKSAEAQLVEAKARQVYAKTQAHRYERLLKTHSVSQEVVATKQQDLNIMNATLVAAHAELARSLANSKGLIAQKNNLKLVATSDGLIVARNVDPGTTVTAGQTVIELINPKSVWINVRFDQISTTHLVAGLSAKIALRSQARDVLSGKVLRIEPLADTVTEETMAKISFDHLPNPLPPLGELANVTVALPALSATPTILNAAIHRKNHTVGVWQVVDKKLHFVSVKLGATDSNGYIQILQGLKVGDKVVVYSEKNLDKHSRIEVVKRIFGARS